jgi:hypothetical protein
MALSIWAETPTLRLRRSPDGQFRVPQSRSEQYIARAPREPDPDPRRYSPEYRDRPWPASRPAEPREPRLSASSAAYMQMPGASPRFAGCA